MKSIFEIFTVDTKENTLKAKINEIESWRKHKVFDEVQDEGQNYVSVRWVLTPKIIEGEMRMKARLVARGFEETTEFRTDSPTCLRESIRIVIAFIVSMKWKLHSVDYKTAFLQGNPIEREVFLRPPAEFRTKDKLWKLKKTVYGLADAPRVWFLRLKEELEKLGAKVSSFDKGIFYWHSKSGLEGIIALFVDDQLWGGTQNFEVQVVNKLRKIFDISYEHDTVFKYVGIELTQHDDGSIYMCQHKYIEAIAPIELENHRNVLKNEYLVPSEKRQYRGLIGQLNWVSGMSRPDIAFEVCQLSTSLSSPKIKDVLRANKVVRYLKGMKTRIKVPDLGKLEKCAIWSFSDASYANLPDGGSQGGFIVFLVNMTTFNVTPIIWKSNKVKRVVRSTLAAETLACLDGCENAFIIQKMLNEIIGITEKNQRPILAKTDNKSLFDTSQTTKTLADPRLRVEMGILREMIEKGEVRVKWIESGRQLADALTKIGASSLNMLQVVSNGTIQIQAEEPSE